MPGKFLYEGHSAHASDRPIKLSYRAFYTRFTDYILLVFAEIVFIEKQKTGFGIAMKKVRDSGFS